MQKKYIAIFFFFLCFFFLQKSRAQYIFPHSQSLYNQYLYAKKDSSHTNFFSVRPVLLSNAPENNYLTISTIPRQQLKPEWLKNKIYTDNLLQTASSNVKLSLNPLFDFSAGMLLKDSSSVYTNMRGFLLQANINEKLYIKSSFYEIQAKFPNYISDYILTNGVVPGSTIAKVFKNDSSQFDYGTAYGLVSYSPIRSLNIQFGTDKNFFGNGYRSLLLSDAGFEYPFLKVQYKNLKWQYTALWAWLQNIDVQNIIEAPHVWYGGFQKKKATFFYLSRKLAKNLEISLFESTIFKARQTNSKFNKMFLNPLMGINSVYYGLEDTVNVQVGINLSYAIKKFGHIYAQALYDGSTTDANIHPLYGYQIGFRYFDCFKIPYLKLQIEYNSISPYTYSNKYPQQSYTHFNQPLAHPLGANINEFITILSYQVLNWHFSYQFSYAKTIRPKDSLNWGLSPFLPQQPSLVFPKPNAENQTTIMHTRVEASYVFNAKTNMRFTCGVAFRKQRYDNGNHKQSYAYIGFCTNLRNKYFDF